MATEPGLAIAAAAALGVATLFPGIRARCVSGLWISALALILAMILFHSAVPAGLEPRYLLMIMPCVILFMVRGAAQAAVWLSWIPLTLPRRAELVAAAIALAFASTTFSFPRVASDGLAQAATFLATRPEFARTVILVSSEGDGEGALIAGVAERDHPRPKHVVLRASRVLADSDWNGLGYSLRFRNGEDIMRYLISIPAGALVMDRTSQFAPNLHQALLEQMLREHHNQWRLMAEFSSGNAFGRNGSVAVYKMLGAEATARRPILLNIGGTLRRTIVVDPL